VRRVSSYFSIEESYELEESAIAMTEEEGSPVTVAEVIRRAVRDFLDRRRR
jgi:hypothetical protein